jgi:uncharacterized protein (TIGR01777 family)
MGSFELRGRIDAPVDRVLEWYRRPGALQRLVAPWQDIEIVEQTGEIGSGARTVFSVGWGPLRTRWVSQEREYREGELLVEEQVEGPFAEWVHQHHFEPRGPDICILTDRISYRIPGGGLGEDFVDGFLRRVLHRMLQFRYARLRRDLRRHARFLDRERLRLVISGATGLIGRQLDAFLSGGGHSVQRLVRRRPRHDAGEIFWDPVRGDMDADALEGVDAVIHLAGENVGGGLWTPERRRRISESRVEGTRLVAETLAGLASRPRALLAASAVGYYGDGGDEELDEQSPGGHGFLADVCRGWEDATRPAARAGIRVANLRLGTVLTAAGGALAMQLPVFRLGLGGPVGGGRQYLSWVALDDVIGAIHHALFEDSIEGPVNVVSPEPVTNAEFARTLAGILRRPAWLPLPAALVRAVLGEMGEALLLSSSRVLPRRLEAAGFPPQFPGLESALRFELGLL